MINKTKSDNWFIDTFESLVDFFSLISFSLITATMIFATQNMSQTQHTVEIYSIGSGEGEAISLPEDTVVLILRYKDQEGILIINEPGKKNKLLKQKINNFSFVIKKEISKLKKYNDFNLVVEKKNGNN